MYKYFSIRELEETNIMKWEEESITNDGFIEYLDTDAREDYLFLSKRCNCTKKY